MTKLAALAFAILFGCADSSHSSEIHARDSGDEPCADYDTDETQGADRPPTCVRDICGNSGEDPFSSVPSSTLCKCGGPNAVYWDDSGDCPYDGGDVLTEPTSACDDPDPTVAAQCQWDSADGVPLDGSGCFTPAAQAVACTTNVPITNDATIKRTFQFQVDTTFTVKSPVATLAAGVRVNRDATSIYTITCVNANPYDYIIRDRPLYGQPFADTDQCTWKGGFSLSFAVLDITKFDFGANFIVAGAQLGVAATFGNKVEASAITGPNDATGMTYADVLTAIDAYQNGQGKQDANDAIKQEWGDMLVPHLVSGPNLGCTGWASVYRFGTINQPAFTFDFFNATFCSSLPGTQAFYGYRYGNPQLISEAACRGLDPASLDFTGQLINVKSLCNFQPNNFYGKPARLYWTGAVDTPNGVRIRTNSFVP